jgi:hypothetical protein
MKPWKPLSRPAAVMTPEIRKEKLSNSSLECYCLSTTCLLWTACQLQDQLRVKNQCSSLLRKIVISSGTVQLKVKGMTPI